MKKETNALFQKSFWVIIAIIILIILLGILVFSKASIFRSPTSCSDSDGGKNYNVLGTADYNYKNYTDFCLNNSRLLEYYCATNTSVRSVNYTCQYGCSNGACQTATYTCTDSDGGKIPNVKGTTIEYLNRRVNKQATDNCTSITSVNENYCGTNNRSASSTMACSAGRQCSNGACLPASYCTDSDGGKVLGVKGTAKQYTNGTLTKTSVDSCNGTARVNEYYCNGALINLSISSCASGSSCSNGACITSNQTNTTQLGHLSVYSVPTGASVRLDYVYRGITPLTLNNISVGSHWITLIKTGYETWTSNVSIYAGQYTVISQTLTTNSTGNSTG